MSRLNITSKPIENPPVAQFSCPRLWVSGMISCDITNSMAPAANPNAHGKIGKNTVTIETPSNPITGSNKPVAPAIKNACSLLYPIVNNANATASPSGAFCMPIPIAKATA